jgi:hypothetical protein
LTQSRERRGLVLSTPLFLFVYIGFEISFYTILLDSIRVSPPLMETPMNKNMQVRKVAPDRVLVTFPSGAEITFQPFSSSVREVSRGQHTLPLTPSEVRDAKKAAQKLFGLIARGTQLSNRPVSVR